MWLTSPEVFVCAILRRALKLLQSRALSPSRVQTWLTHPLYRSILKVSSLSVYPSCYLLYLRMQFSCSGFLLSWALIAFSRCLMGAVGVISFSLPVPWPMAHPITPTTWLYPVAAVFNLLWEDGYSFHCLAFCSLHKCTNNDFADDAHITSPPNMRSKWLSLSSRMSFTVSELKVLIQKW